MQGNAKASSIPYGNNSSAGTYIKSDDAKIYYEVYGKGSPVIVLHGGIVGSSLEMGRFIDSLSQKHQVIAISTRGHGKSEMGSKIPSYEQKAKDVNAVVEKVTKDKVTILGFSDGAYTGYYFAKNYPEKIEKLIAIGAGEWKKGFREFKMDYNSFSAMDESFWKQQMAIRPEPKRIDEWFSTLSSYYNNLNIDQTVLGQIKCPVLVMAGEKDQNAPFDTVIAAYKMIPNAQLAIIPNAPHPAFLVNFDAVWADMKPFLNQNN
jgi:pimeloyl-ACP methyl ester carboxylesterase